MEYPDGSFAIVVEKPVMESDNLNFAGHAYKARALLVCGAGSVEAFGYCEVASHLVAAPRKRKHQARQAQLQAIDRLYKQLKDAASGPAAENRD